MLTLLSVACRIASGRRVEGETPVVDLTGLRSKSPKSCLRTKTPPEISCGPKGFFLIDSLQLELPLIQVSKLLKYAEFYNYQCALMSIGDRRSHSQNSH